MLAPQSSTGNRTYKGTCEIHTEFTEEAQSMGDGVIPKEQRRNPPVVSESFTVNYDVFALILIS